MYGIGGFLALLGVLLRFGLPESTRWLITHGRPKEAERIVSEMEARAFDPLEELPPLESHFPSFRRLSRLLMLKSSKMNSIGTEPFFYFQFGSLDT